MRRRPIRLHFENRGQACTWWDVMPDGEHHWRVVRCADETWLWQRTRVCKRSVKVGRPPRIFGDVSGVLMPTTIPIVKISRVPPQPAPPLRSHAITEARARAIAEAADA